MKRRCVLQVGIFVLLVSVVPIDVLALDLMYPGVTCRYMGPAAEDDFLDPWGLKANGLRNRSSSTETVRCPISKRNTRDVEYASIVLTTSSINTCKLAVSTALLNQEDEWPPTSVTNIGNGRYRHVWSGNYPSTNYVASIVCDVPPNVIVESYVSRD